MSDGGETSRLSIPDNVQSTIQNIRDITKKQHSDDEIYAVLKECSMDPNETAQKLLYLDTFHEVKNRRDRRKENVKGKASEDIRPAPGAHRRMVRGGGQGTYSSDAGGVRNSFARKETGASRFVDGGSLSSSVPVQQKTVNNAAAPIPKASSVIPNGIKKLPNGTPSHVDAPKPPTADDAPKSSVVAEALKSSTAVDANKLGAAAPCYANVLASKPGTGLKDQRKTPAIVNQLPTPATTASDSGVHVHVPASDSSLSTQVQENKDISDDSVDMGLSKSEKVSTRSTNHVIKEKTQSHTAKVAGNNQSTKSSQPPASSTAIVHSQSNGQSQQESSDALKVVTPEVDITVEATSKVPHRLTLSDVKHVTFPNHIKVPESFRNALTFGSINATFGASTSCVNGTGGNDSIGNAELSQDNDEAATEPSPSNNNLAASVQGDLSEKSLASPNVLEKLQTPEGNVSSTTDSKSELLKQDLQLFPEVPHNLPTLNGPSYNLGFLPPMLGHQVLQVEGHDNQVNDAPRVSHFGENSTGVPSPNTTPPLPNSVAASPQSIPVFRHPYPANYFPYGGYIPPYYMPMHQFYPNGFPPHLIPPSTPTTGDIKYPSPQFKSGSNPGSAPQYNIHSVGYAPGPAINSGNSAANNEDHGASQVKESHIYTAGQLTEGSTVWYHTPGQDISSLYNLPQGQRYAYSPVHAGHGAMTGMYPPGQTMASPTYLQQSQAMAGATETIGPPPNAYQQPQHAQMNWNSNF